MKNLLTAIVLLIFCQNTYANITLEFKDIQNPKKEHKLQFSIDKTQLIFSESGSDRVNTYHSQKQQFISTDPETGKSSMVNEEILANRVSELNQQRLKKLEQIESNLQEKMKTMNADEQKVGESLVNLLKYPDIYGEHTHLIIKKSDTEKQIDKLSCQVYKLYLNNHLLKEYCMTSRKSLGMNKLDYLTLRSFYAFEYKMQTRIMIAMGNTRFSLVDFEKEKIPGIVIETIRYEKNKPVQHLILKSVKGAD